MTPDEFKALLMKAETRDAFSGDYALNPSTKFIRPATFRDAAVLMPVMLRPEGLQLLFTQRTEHLAQHAGQISFPGGKVDAGDESVFAAALREAWEEIGLPAQNVEVLRQLPPYETGSGFRINPVVAFVNPDFDIVPHSGEVAQVFERPLLDCLNPAHHRIEESQWQSHKIHYYVIELDGKRIWGATAGMLVSLSRTLGLRQ